MAGAVLLRGGCGPQAGMVVAATAAVPQNMHPMVHRSGMAPSFAAIVSVLVATCSFVPNAFPQARPSPPPATAPGAPPATSALATAPATAPATASAPATTATSPAMAPFTLDQL